MTQLFDALHSANPRSQIWTQEARIRCFMGKSSNGGKLLVDGIGGQTPRFEMHAIAHDDDAIECQTRFRAVPGNELFDGVLIDATGTGRSEAVQHRQLGMIQIRETKYGPTIVSFVFRFPMLAASSSPAVD